MRKLKKDRCLFVSILLAAFTEQKRHSPDPTSVQSVPDWGPAEEGAWSFSGAAAGLREPVRELQGWRAPAPFNSL